MKHAFLNTRRSIYIQGDCIVAVNGQKVRGFGLAELAEHMLGTPGTVVTLDFKRNQTGVAIAVCILYNDDLSLCLGLTQGIL